MFTKKLFTLTALALVIFISAASGIKAQETKTIEVDGTVKFVDTGVKLNKGDVVQVTNVTGDIKVNTAATTGKNYEGNKNTVTSSDYFEYRNAGEHALVMWVGDKSKHKQVRKHIAEDVATDGNLFFAFNDGKNYYGDNSGKFTVTYKIIRKDKVCSPPTNQKVNIAWKNETGKTLRINWINFDCTEEKNNREIKPGEVYDGYSFVGHLFRVRDFTSNEDYGFITVDNSNAKMSIVK